MKNKSNLTTIEVVITCLEKYSKAFDLSPEERQEQFGTHGIQCGLDLCVGMLGEVLRDETEEDNSPVRIACDNSLTEDTFLYPSALTQVNMEKIRKVIQTYIATNFHSQETVHLIDLGFNKFAAEVRFLNVRVHIGEYCVVVEDTWLNQKTCEILIDDFIDYMENWGVTNKLCGAIERFPFHIPVDQELMDAFMVD